MNRILARLVAFVLVAGCSDSLSPEDYYAVWGGEGARLTLSPTLARFETSCWAGDMAIPIQVDGAQFKAIGNIHSQGGAGVPETKAVTLIGRLSGDVLRLTVETSFAIGPFRLERDTPVEVPGCP
jgi:hypothetical protein